MKNLPTIFLFLMLGLLFSNTGYAQNWRKNSITGEGKTVTETLDLPSFEGIGLSISADVYLKQGNAQSVKIEAQKNIIDNIEREVTNKVWKIKFDKSVRNYEDVKIWITIPHLNQVAVSGSGDIQGENTFSNLNELELAISGSGSIELDAESKSVNVSISGSGDMELGGTTGKQNVSISGSGDVDAYGLSSKTCQVSIAGSGDCQLTVTENLTVSLVGSGDVYYKGNPSVHSKIVGSGDVIAK